MAEDPVAIRGWAPGRRLARAQGAAVGEQVAAWAAGVKGAASGGIEGAGDIALQADLRLRGIGVGDRGR